MAPEDSNENVEAGRRDERSAASPELAPLSWWLADVKASPANGAGEARRLDGLDFTKRDYTDDERVVTGDELKRMLGIKDGVVSEPVVIRHAVIETGGELDLRRLTFKRGLSVTESTFRGDVLFSFCAFEQEVDLTGTVFEGRADFRAARAEKDFRMPLAGFGGPARFDDFYVGEVLDAEGASFMEASFDRVEVRKSARFCCALLDDGRGARTRFRGGVTFNDARLCGPDYFNGACFEGKAYFDRARIDSSAFFNCDLLSAETNPSQPKHETRLLLKLRPEGEARVFFPTEFEDTASFIGAQINGSVSFSGARFGKQDAAAAGRAGAGAHVDDESAPRADFRRVHIEGTALFDPFERKGSGVFEPVRFNYDAIFWNASIKGAARFEAVHFGGKADFEHVQVGRRAYFCAAGPDARPVPTTFCGDANFLDAEVQGTVTFEGAQFGGHATFERLTTNGSLFFRAYESKPPAFDADGKRVFVTVKFARSARFVSSRTRSNFELDGAQFPADQTPKGDAAGEEGAFVKDEANFARMVVGGNLYLRPWTAEGEVVRFAKKAVFAGVEIKGRSEFSGTCFESGADFTGMQVTGNAYFDCKLYRDEGDRPQAEGRPAGGQPPAAAAEKEPKKIGPVTFKRAAEFNGAAFRNQVSFEGAVFEQKADFTGVSSAGEVTFEGARFDSDAVFREARFTSLRFDRKGPRKKGWIKRLATYLWARRSEKTRKQHKEARDAARRPERQFGGSVDLRGCVYDRIEVKLRSLLGQLKVPAPDGADDLRRYDRQPYTQMSKSLRAVGDDRRAEFVYVRQRLRELKATLERLRLDLKDVRLWHAFRGFANLLLDCLLWAVAQFGVQPERLLVISVVVIAIGAKVFSFGGAVQYRDDDPDSPPTATIQVAQALEPWTLKVDRQDAKRLNLGWRDSLRFSVSQFLPVVDIPSGGKWKPSQEGHFWFLSPDFHIPYDVYGSAHRLLGALLVPLLLAAVAASLYRRFKTEM